MTFATKVAKLQLAVGPRVSGAPRVSVVPGLFPQFHGSLHPVLRPLASATDLRGVGSPLSPRDRAILVALDGYRYLDRAQLATLFFPSRRSAQYAIHDLVGQGLIGGWRCTWHPGRISGPSIFVLTAAGARVAAQHLEEDPRRSAWRARNAANRTMQLVHDLEANQFFVSIVEASRERSDEGLYHWLGEATCRTVGGITGSPRSDGWGRYLLPDRELLFDLEWDRGTEGARQLETKITAYLRYFVDRQDAKCRQVLLVAPLPQREEEVRRVIADALPHGAEVCRFWTTTASSLSQEGPLAAIWREVQADERVSLSGMPGVARSDRSACDSVGKLRWWERRLAGGEGA